MRMSTYTHGVLDYLTAAVLIVVPALVLLLGGPPDEADPAAASQLATALWLLLVAGVLILGLSLLTRYELGAVRAVPMAGHIAVDIVLGLALIASPWIFGFADVLWWPHVAVGLLAVGSAVLTRPASTREDPAFATHPNATVE